MQKALNMKLLILILTALAALSAVVVNHEIHVAQETRRANIAEKLQHDREQIRKDDAEYREQEQIQKQLEALKKKSHSYAGNEAKSWTNNKP
jgi:ribulose kinase